MARDSRLPQGLVIPPGLTRADVSATVDFYTLGKVKLTLRDKRKRKIGVVIGHQMGNPVYSKTSVQGFEPGYPAYVLIVIDGQIEIIEFKHPGDVANITDSPGIRKETLGRHGSAMRQSAGCRMSSYVLSVSMMVESYFFTTAAGLPSCT
jgi:hypothetical protein